MEPFEEATDRANLREDLRPVAEHQELTKPPAGKPIFNGIRFRDLSRTLVHELRTKSRN